LGSDDAIQFIILIILLLLSGFFSSAETALTTASQIRMRTLEEEGNKRAKTVLRITENSSKLLSTILIGNNIVNTAGLPLLWQQLLPTSWADLWSLSQVRSLQC